MSVNDNGIVTKSNNYLSQLAQKVHQAENYQSEVVRVVAERIALCPRQYIGDQMPDGRIVNLRPVKGERDALTPAEEMVLAYSRRRLGLAMMELHRARRKIYLDEQARAVHIHDHERRTLQRGGLDAGGTDGSI